MTKKAGRFPDHHLQRPEMNDLAEMGGILQPLHENFHSLHDEPPGRLLRADRGKRGPQKGEERAFAEGDQTDLFGNA